MELNSIFVLVLVVSVAVGLCGMGYCHCINKKRSEDGVHEL